MKAVVVIGQATGPGRLTAAAEVVRDELASGGAEVAVVDLHGAPVELCDGRADDAYGAATRDAVAVIAGAGAVVVLSPVYRATVPGVLKNLIDLLPVAALRGKPVGIVAVGATDHHYLGVDGDLRRILAWFGALPLPTGVYLSSAGFGADKRPTATAEEELRALSRSALAVARALAGIALGPTPLAARRG